jgi:hypothetical protein
MTLLSNDEVLKLREKGKKGKKNIAYFTRKYI